MSTVAHTVWVNPVNFNPICKSITSLIATHTHTHKTTYWQMSIESCHSPTVCIPGTPLGHTKLLATTHYLTMTSCRLGGLRGSPPMTHRRLRVERNDNHWEYTNYNPGLWAVELKQALLFLIDVTTSCVDLMLSLFLQYNYSNSKN